jgi:hypothetical protein
MFPFKNDNEESSNNGKEWSFSSLANKNKDDFYSKAQTNVNTNAQTFLSGLERLTKLFGESHLKF